MSLAESPEAQRLPVTVVVPVKNEARNLPTCLASLASVARVVVVDSGSTDETCAIAEAWGAEVLQFQWPGGFPKKRNWVLETYAFQTEWVLFLDADEALTPGFLAELGPALASPDIAGFWLNYDNHFMDRVLRHGVPQRKLALFRVGSGFYERIEDPGWSTLDMEVHEHPILSGRLGEIGARIDHRDFRGLHHYIARHNDYSSWEARRYGALVNDRAAWDALTPRQRLKYANLTRWWFAPAYFLNAYLARGGFLDGRAGFVHAALKFSYFFEIRLKIAEVRRQERR